MACFTCIHWLGSGARSYRIIYLQADVQSHPLTFIVKHIWTFQGKCAHCHCHCHYHCVVPENIHTPTTEGIGNSGGVGGRGWGSRAQEIPERRGVVSEITFPDGEIRCCDDPVRKSLLTYFADILHRINITSGIWYTIMLHFKQVFFLVVAHLKLTSSQKSSMFRGCDRHYIETSHGLTEMHWWLTLFMSHAQLKESCSCSRKVSVSLFISDENGLTISETWECLLLVIPGYSFKFCFVSVHVCDFAIMFTMNVININQILSFLAWLERKGWLVIHKCACYFDCLLLRKFL